MNAYFMTVKGLLELARQYYAAADDCKQAAVMIGGSWWAEWNENRAAALRCVTAAEEILGDFELLPKDIQDLYIPF